ncbi:MAG: hypothetical protein ACR2K2_04115 [Mycobacteriales bacterium]
MAKEVDDVVNLSRTRVPGRTSSAARTWLAMAPISAAHATGLPVGYHAAAAQVAVDFGARVTDLPGLHPRAAPV